MWDQLHRLYLKYPAFKECHTIFENIFLFFYFFPNKVTLLKYTVFGIFPCVENLYLSVVLPARALKAQLWEHFKIGSVPALQGLKVNFTFSCQGAALKPLQIISLALAMSNFFPFTMRCPHLCLRSYVWTDFLCVKVDHFSWHFRRLLDPCFTCQSLKLFECRSKSVGLFLGYSGWGKWWVNPEAPIFPVLMG